MSGPFGGERLLLPLTRRPGVCTRCFNLTDGSGLCFACTLVEPWLSFMASISYSISGSPLHRALWGYKHLSGDAASDARLELAILLAHYLSRHERCAAQAVGRGQFDLVAAVPSSDPARAGDHPLRLIVERMVPATAQRSQHLLRRTDVAVSPHRFHAERFAATRPLSGESVLLIDDTWTTGANAQSAAAALRGAGSGPVAAVVIGRHLNRRWLRHKKRMAELQQPFAWGRCAVCSGASDSGRALAAG